VSGRKKKVKRGADKKIGDQERKGVMKGGLGAGTYCKQTIRREN